MGLDMYLTKKITAYVDPDSDRTYEHQQDAGYWRKANQIHGWFVREIQGGVDDCGSYPVSFEKLMELRDLCKKVLEIRDTSLLPPCEGFFFGSGAVDECYFYQLEDTIRILEDLEENRKYFYQSSW